MGSSRPPWAAGEYVIVMGVRPKKILWDGPAMWVYAVEEEWAASESYNQYTSQISFLTLRQWLYYFVTLFPPRAPIERAN